jgi:hypothetical protein
MLKYHVQTANMFMGLWYLRRNLKGVLFFSENDRWFLYFKKKYIVATTIMDNIQLAWLADLLAIPHKQYYSVIDQREVPAKPFQKIMERKLINYLGQLQSGNGYVKSDYFELKSNDYINENIIIGLANLKGIKSSCHECIVNFNCKCNMKDVDIGDVCEEGYRFFENFCRKYIKNFSGVLRR